MASNTSLDVETLFLGLKKFYPGLQDEPRWFDIQRAARH